MISDSQDIVTLLCQWNNYSIPELTTTVPALFISQCVVSADEVALVCGDRQLLYRELGIRVMQLAHALLDNESEPESVIAIGVPRSAEMVICVLAAMVAGLAFVPVDPKWPLHRRRQICADAKVISAFISSDDESDWGVKTLGVDIENWCFHDQSITPPAVSIAPEQLAYIIFTSGSTGKPKGAMIRHEAIAERLMWQRDHILNFGSDDAALFKAPLTFDISINEILLPLVSGGRVVIAHPEGEKDPEYLLQLISTHQVTFVYLVSSMLDALLELNASKTISVSGVASAQEQDHAEPLHALASLRHVWCGGEILTPELFSRFRSQLATTLYHGYGPAEATIGISHVIYRDNAQRIATSIGRPNPHTQLYVLDDHMRPVAPGVGGELYAAGFLLARGYINDPVLTSSRFIANPFDNNGSRLYRTGDRARWTLDGSLEFLGRNDNQVKIRGRRIELEEIETILNEHEAIRQAVTAVHRDGDREQLVGYIVTSDEVTDDAMRTWCHSRLPDYMVPAVFVRLDRLPLTDNGKIDRQTLPAPSIIRTVDNPRTVQETLLCEAFSHALGLDSCGINEDFFALGGDSIIAIRVVSLLRSQGFRLRPRDLFSYRTVATLAPYVTHDVPASETTHHVQSLSPVGPVLSTPIMHWLSEVASSSGSVLHGFYQGVSLISPVNLEENILRLVLREVLSHHHVLWAQVHPDMKLTIASPPPEPQLFMSDLSEGVHSSDAITVLCQKLVNTLDPAAGVMVAFGWLRQRNCSGRLVIIAHHTVIDGVSLRILADDIAKTYQRMSSGHSLVQTTATTSWRHWAQSLTDATREGFFDNDLPYWRRTCSSPAALCSGIELDPLRDTVATEQKLSIELPAPVSEALLSTVPERIYGHVNDALVAALYLALRYWRKLHGDDSDSLLLEMEGHGREGQLIGDIDLSDTVGWFTTLYPVLLSDDDFDWNAALSGGSALRAAVAAIKDQLRAVPSHGLSYGALRYLRNADPTLVATPQVLFNYLGKFTSSEHDWAFSPQHTVLENRDPQMPLPRVLEVNAEAMSSDSGTVLRATFSWPAAIASESDIAVVVQKWVDILTDIAGNDDIAGHSASDFPRVPLTTHDIVCLEEQYPQLIDILPLTPAQQGIYFHSTFSHHRDPYVVQQIIDITGNLDVERFQRATEIVAQRHQALALAFTTVSHGTPVAVHIRDVVPDFNVIDARMHNSAEVIMQRAEQDRLQGFNLAEAPLTRYTLIRISDDVYTMIQTVHHIIADGWSVPRILDDLLLAYKSGDIQTPDKRFSVFLDWLSTVDYSADHTIWSSVLKDITAPTRVTAIDGTGHRSNGFGRHCITLGSKNELVTTALDMSVTMSTLLHALWGILLGRLTGSSDVVFGTVVSGRDADIDGIETLVGMLVNTIVVRVQWANNDTVAHVASRLAVTESYVMGHQHFPLMMAHRIAGIDQLFDSLMVIHNLDNPSYSDSDLTYGDMTVIENPHYPLTVMIDFSDTVTMTVTNDREEVSDTVANTVGTAFVDLVQSVIENPQIHCSAIKLGHQKQLSHVKQTTTVTQLLRATVEYSDTVAVVTQEKSYTFAQLHSYAEQLAARLVHSGVCRGDVVAVALPRSVDLIAALWAVIYSGAAYLPIDLSYPPSRIHYMINHARPRAIILTDTVEDDQNSGLDLTGMLPDGAAVIAISPIAESSLSSSLIKNYEPAIVHPYDAVSVLYTSGSTGEPKAVVGTHGALAHRLQWAGEQWPATVRLAKSSLSFIDGTTELLAAITAGSCTVLADDATATHAELLGELIAEHSVEQVVAVPSLAMVLAQEFGQNIGSIRRWITSGEALESHHLKTLHSVCPEATVVNSYGSSEVTGDVLTGVQDNADKITLGKPVPHTVVRVLDTALADTPVGVIGEIYVGSVQLARGYKDNPAQTASYFIATENGERLYRTGDLGALLPHGEVIFAGRADDQITIHGYRVEPAEIEAVLTRCAGIEDAVVIAVGATLLALIVLDNNVIGADDPAVWGISQSGYCSELLTVVASQLPHYMVPAAVYIIDHIPLLPNGKRDNATLKTMSAYLQNCDMDNEVDSEIDTSADNDFGGHNSDSIASASAVINVIQRVVTNEMADVLDRDAISATADFVAVGGDSITAIRLSSRLARAGYVVTIEDIFRYRTAIRLAQKLQREQQLTSPGLDMFQGSQEVLDLHHSPTPYETVDLSLSAIEGLGSGIDDVWAMSPLQQGIYYQCILDTTGFNYVAQNIFDINHRIDIESMQRAFVALLERHPQLRVSFQALDNDDGAALVQLVHTEVNPNITVIDLSENSMASVAADQIINSDRVATIDISTAPLLRLTVIQLPDGCDKILFTYHFLLFDGWSRELVLRELFALYASHGNSGVLERHDSIVVRYLSWLQNVDIDSAERAWSEVLANLSGPTLVSGVAPGHPHIAVEEEPHRIVFTVSAELTRRIYSAAKLLNVTPSSVITASLAIVTGYQAGTSDAVVGTTVAGRPGELVGIESTIGLFLNTVPVRVNLHSDHTIAEIICAIDQQRIMMMRHDHLGLGQIQRAAGDAASSLFDSLLVFQNFLDDSTFVDWELDHGVTGVNYHDSTHFPLTWVLTPGNELTIKLEYRVIDHSRAQQMVDQLHMVLKACADNVHSAVGAVNIIASSHRQQLQHRWSNTHHRIPDTTIAELLAERAELIPDATALICGERRVSFGDLNNHITQLAQHMIHYGAQPETFIALALPRSIEMVVALFAVLRSGAAYVPLELDLPDARLRSIIADARPKLVITTREYLQVFSHICDDAVTIIVLDDPDTADELAQYSKDIRTMAAVTDFTGSERMKHPAYLIYTSGSTGKPKGVLTGYAGLTNMFFNHQNAIFNATKIRLNITDSSQLAIAHTVSFAFDMSWEELFWLVEGHTVHICDEVLRRDAPALVQYCHHNRIDVINVTPSYAQHLCDAGLLDDIYHLPALVLLGGEAVSDDLWSLLRHHRKTLGYNLYGPTEYTINTLGGSTDDSATAIVGQPIWNTRSYILDTNLRPVPDGSVGELYIAGIGLARGYHRQPALTAAAIVADPYYPGERMYRTGDMMRYNDNGQLEFLGRVDDQVKIRGYRVELGEIESVLATVDGVARCAVITRSGLDDHSKILAAYVVPTDHHTNIMEFISRIRDELAVLLPAYMVPVRFAVVEAFPLTINGKLDIAALPEPIAVLNSTGRTARRVEEALLIEIISAVLAIPVNTEGHPGVGVDDDFFALGGDSISSITVCGRARKAGLHITPGDIFLRRTIAAITAPLTVNHGSSAGHSVVNSDDGIGPIQRTPMLAETVMAATPLNNFYQAMVLNTPPTIRVEQLRNMITAILTAHGMLRARLHHDVDGWTLHVPSLNEPLPDVLTVENIVLTAESINEAVSAAAAELSPHDGVMMRAIWYKNPSSIGQLLLVIHHVVVDGVSWRILCEDLARLWTDTHAGRPGILDDATTSFQTWSAALSLCDYDDEICYWNEVLSTPDPALGRRRYNQTIDISSSVVKHSFSLDTKISSALLSSAASAVYGGSNDVLLTALALALAQWRSRRGYAENTASAINIEGHGREPDVVDAELDVSRTIGWFTVVYPVRIDPGQLSWHEVLSADYELAQALKSVKEQLRTVPRRGLGYGALRYCASDSPIRGESPQILFNYLGRFGSDSSRFWGPVAEYGALREGVDDTNPAVPLEITVLAEDRRYGTVLTATLAWPEDLMDSADMTELADLWSEALIAMTALAQRTELRGHTPSDFRCITVTQHDIDTWERDGSIDDVLPLLPLQEGMYLHSTFHNGTDPYRVQQVAQLSGPLDYMVFKSSIQAVIRRHHALRTSFRELTDGRIAQVIWSEVEVDMCSIQSSHEGYDNHEEYVKNIAEEELQKNIDLSKPPLVRYVVVSLSDTEHRLIQTIHHSIADGWSYPVIFADIVAHYNAAVDAGYAPEPIVTSFSDYVETIHGYDTTYAQRMWSEALAHAEPTVLFPDKTTIGEHRSVARQFSVELTTALAEQARQYGLTISTVLHGLWGVLLGLSTDRRNVVFGSTVSGRGASVPGIESIVGLFINTVAVPMSWDYQTPLATVLCHLQDHQSALLDVQYLGLSELSRLSGHQTLCDTVVVVENFSNELKSSDDHPQALNYQGFTGTDTPHYPIACIAFPGDQLTVEIKYETTVVTVTQAERLIDWIETLITTFITQPDQVMGSLQLDSKDATTPQTIPGDCAAAETMYETFAKVVQLQPQAIAVNHKDEHLTYAELNNRAYLVAQALINLGVKPESRVAIALPRSLDLIVAVLAVGMAGGAYVALDINSPRARVKYILSDSEPVCILTDSKQHFSDSDVPVLLMTDAIHFAENSSDSDSDNACIFPTIDADHAAYIMYTSGSTGTPKGVVMTHRNVAALFNSAALLFDTTAEDVWTMFHSVAFDVSVWELWSALSHGGRLVIVDAEVTRDPEQFIHLLCAEKVTVLTQTPSAFYPLVEAAQRIDRRVSLRYIVFAGEALDFRRLSAWYAHHGDRSPQLVNMYGITETCVHISFYPITIADTVRNNSDSLIGQALPGAQIHLLDRRLQPVPVGVVGEIYISGEQVARGYADRPGLTASRFIANPHDRNGQRLYRSGDTALWNDDHELIYLGRSDQQVKIRGYRIELGEVESALVTLPDVENAAVAVDTSTTGHPRLIGYLVGSGLRHDQRNLQQMRTALAQYIPEYMVPASFIVLDRLPLTINGKLDRAALPAPTVVQDFSEVDQRSNAEILAQLCTDILGSSVTATDDFFVMGGDSIIAIQLVNRARRLGIQITPQQVFIHRTPVALAEAASESLPQSDSSLTNENFPRDIGELMLTPIVQRLAELGGSISYVHQAELVYTPIGATAQRIHAALNTVMSCHDALRLQLHRPNSLLWSLEVCDYIPQSTIPFRHIDVRDSDDDRLYELISDESHSAVSRLDPDNGIMVQAVWFDRGQHTHGRLLLVVHHLAIDTVSWRILLEDLSEAYRLKPLARVPVSIRSYARMTNEKADSAARLAEYDYWQKVLSPGGELLPQANSQRLTFADTSIHQISLDIDQNIGFFDSVLLGHNMDMTEFLLTVLYMAISRWRATHGVDRGTALTIDVERHGRDHWGDDIDLSRTIGWFTTIAPVRLVSMHDTLAKVAKDIKEQVRTVVDGGQGFGQLKYCNARTARALGQLPTPHVLFNYLGRQPNNGITEWNSAAESAAIYVAPAPDLGTAYLLEINTFWEDHENGSQLHTVITYATNVISNDSITELAEHFTDTFKECIASGAAKPASPEVTSGQALTPSDLTLVDLSQKQIDHIIDTSPGLVETVWPLSPLQEGVYFQTRYSSTAIYIVQNIFDVQEPLDVNALHTAYSAVMKRHAVLRSGFLMNDLRHPVAAIAVDPVFTPEVIDLTGLSEDLSDLQIAEITAEERLRTFDVETPPLARFTIIKTGQYDRLIFSYHFLLCDGWSREHLINELFAEYTRVKNNATAGIEINSAPVSFADYLLWLTKQDRSFSAQRWAEAMSDLSEPTLLFPHAVNTEPAVSHRLDVTLSPEQTIALTQRAHDYQVTLNSVLSTALALVLGYETGSQDVVFGSTVAGRPVDIDDVDSIIGLFLNTVPTRVKLEPQRRIAETVRNVQSDRLKLMDHEYLGLGDIIRAVGLGTTGELFDSLYVLQNFLDDDTFTDMEADYGIMGHDSVDASHYPLTWVVSPGRQLVIKLEYQPDSVTRERAHILLSRFRQVLLYMIANPDAELASIPLALPDECHELAIGFAGVQHPLPDITVVDLLADRCDEVTPALVCGADSLTYRDLNTRITDLASLLHNRGIGKNSIVALAIPRSIDAIIAIFAVLRSGAAYLPLELDYPDERLLAMIADASPDCILTASTVMQRMVTLSGDCPLFNIDAEIGTTGTAYDDVLLDWSDIHPHIDDPAYIIYTSGSTGKPKGVVTQHRGLTNMYFNHQEKIFEPTIIKAGGRRLRIAHTVSFSFDMSWEELLWLIHGHEVHICDEELRRDAAALVAYCREHSIDVINVTPSYAELLFAHGLLDSVDYQPILVLLGGEAVSASVWNTLRNSDISDGYNLYGPTEYTINTLGAGTHESAVPTVGKPIWNTSVYILDSWLRPVPDGVAGELYITGVGLAREYLHRPALTAHRFIANPFSQGRMYRTGDMVMRCPDGNIAFLGRVDDQVKIRGHRVEPGEVTAALAAHPLVRNAAVIAVQDLGATSDHGAVHTHRLIGYVVTDGNHVNLSMTLRQELRKTLPSFMIPAHIVMVDELPLTANGKLDVLSLPDATAAQAGTFRAPRSETEKILCDLFADLLGVTIPFGIDNDFFECGGHSLLSIQLITRIREVLGVTISLRDIFDAPTVAELVSRIDQAAAGTEITISRPELTPMDRPDSLPASTAQQRMLIVDQLSYTGMAYNYPLVFRVNGSLDLQILRQAIHDVVTRHESLRTIFSGAENSFSQQVLDPGTAVPINIVQCASAEFQHEIMTACHHHFDLSKQIPLRVTLLHNESSNNTDNNEYVVVILLHHIAMDERSDGPLISDLNTAYTSRLAGNTFALQPLAIQYGDYTLWQQKLLEIVGEQQRQFWHTALLGAPDELALPTDRPRPAQPTGIGATVNIQIPDDITAKLQKLCRDRQMSMLMVFHTCLAVFLHRMGSGDDIVLGTAVAGRSEANMDELVGFFVNTVVLRTKISGNQSLDDILAHVRDVDLTAFAHQDLPFEYIVEDLNPARIAGRNPLFNVFMGYHRHDSEPTTMFGLPTQWYEPPLTTAMFDLGFTLVEKADDSAILIAEYSVDMFNHDTVQRLLDRLIMILRYLSTDTALRISDLDILDPYERTELLHTRNNTEHVVESATLADLVSRQAQRTPDATAVMGEDTHLTYSQLDRWSDQLATQLGENNLRYGDIVAVALPRSVELIVTLVAVAKSGAAFLPLDSDYPAARVAFMLEDAHPTVIIDDIEKVRAAQHSSYSHVSDAVRGIPHLDTVAPKVNDACADTSWAYLLYTSGSTGKPKGVVVPHAGIVNRISWLQHAYPLSSADRMLVKTPVSFDTSVWEIFWPLSVGATLVLARPGGHRDPSYLAETIVAQQITAVDFVPSMLELFLDDPRSAQCESLSRVTVGGEALTADLTQRFERIFGNQQISLHNLYGPTEASVDVLGWTFNGELPALGVPGWNVGVYVLDQYLHMVPPGCPGELYISGVQLADGYIHRHSVTAQRFVANPFDQGSRMYRTGDLVRWRESPGGTAVLEYLGRTDDQITLRGVRIEPGEIETLLSSHPAVSTARVGVCDGRLVAYYLCGESHHTTQLLAEQLREHMAAVVPGYMVPSAFIEVEEFPLTPSGKLDRQALSEIQWQYDGQRYPLTPLQWQLCELFTEILGIEICSVDTDFFVAGGHSLLLVRLAAAIRRIYGVDIGVAELMMAPTVAGVIDRMANDAGADSFGAVLALREEGTEPPLFCVHPASGLSWQFAGLKGYLDDRIPLYGLQSPLFSGLTLPSAIHELACDYADTITLIAPHGPIRLLGWSFGGSLALLIAQEMQRRGRKIVFLGMLDTRMGSLADDNSDSSSVLRNLLREMGLSIENQCRPTVAEAIEMIRANPNIGNTLFEVLDDAQLARVIEHYIISEQLTVEPDYGSYDGDVFFVDALLPEDDGADTHIALASDQWYQHITGELRVCQLGYRHSELLDPTVLCHLGPIIAAEIMRQQG